MLGSEKQKIIDPDKLVRALLGSIPDVAKKQFAEEHKYLKYQENPVLFGEDILKETYTEDIKKMMYSVRDYPVTVAMSSTAPGKTHGAAAISIWFYKCFPNSQVYTAAAPPEDNLKRLLWGEIAKKAHRNPDIFKDDNINVMNIARNEWSFLTGVTIPSTGTEEERISKFSGKHAPYLLFVLDEGDAIPDEVYHGIDGCMSGGFARLLIMFNPKREAGEAYRMTRDKTANVVHLTAFNHPNVITGRNIIPGAVSQEITLRRINEQTMALPSNQEPDNECFEVPDFLVGKVGFNNQNKPYPPLSAGWRRILENSFYYTVLGEYPSKGSDQLISKEWVNRARSNWDLYDAKDGGKPPKDTSPIVGLDVADLGDDWNAFCPRYGNWVAQITKWRGVDPTETSERSAQEAREIGAFVVNVDSIGVGASVPHAIRKLGLRTARIMASESPTEKPRDRKAEFNKLRDQMWWEVREWLRTNESAMLPPDEALIEELLAATYEEKNGKIRVMSKDQMKKVLRRSPDTAESLVLTFAPKQPPPRFRVVKFKG